MRSLHASARLALWLSVSASSVLASPQQFVRRYDVGPSQHHFPTVCRELANGSLLYAGKSGGSSGNVTYPVSATFLAADGGPLSAVGYPDISNPDGLAYLADALALPGGGYFACGQAFASNHSYPTRWLGRFDDAGGPLWTWRMAEGGGGTNESGLTGLCLTPDGGVVVTGWETQDSCDIKANIYRFDGAGNLVWGRVLGDFALLDNVAGSDVVTLPDGGYVTAAYTDGGSVLLALDEQGDILWRKRFQNVTSHRPRLAVTSNGEIVMAAGWGRDFQGADYIWSLASIGNDGLVLRLDTHGGLIFSSAYGESPQDTATDVCATPDGGCVVLGDSSAFGGRDSDLRLIQLDASGEIVWQRLYGSSAREQALSLERTAQGDLIVVGRRWVEATERWEGLLLRTDSLGMVAGCEPANTWTPRRSLDTVEGVVFEVFGPQTHSPDTVDATPATGPTPDSEQICLSLLLGNNYCTSSPNSTGFPARISALGSASVAGNDLVLVALPVPVQPGLFFYGPGQTAAPFGNGTLCVSGGSIGLARLPVEFATGGALVHFLDNAAPPAAALQIDAGETWNFSCWFRDPAGGGAFFDLSDGVELTFEP